MIVTFKFIGLTFEADAIVGDDYDVEFTSLTYEGRDVSFLALSTLSEDLEDAAFAAMLEMERQMAVDVGAERAAEDELFSEETP